MADQTLQIIKAIEVKAEEIIKQAKHDALADLKKLQVKHEQEILTLKTELKNKEEEALKTAESEAALARQNIESQTQEQIKAIKHHSLSKIASAEREMLKCL